MATSSVELETTSIDVDELRTLLESNTPVTVLDVRSTADRDEWSIPGSLHFDAYEAIKAGDPNALSELELPTATPVVTVCGAGKASQVAAEQLRARGIVAKSLTGGMKAWSLAWNMASVPLPGSEVTVIQVRRTGKGCLSYLVGSRGEAAVIDASVDPTVYQELARRCGWSITRVVDTHIHADHVSRNRMLANRTGAKHYLPRTARAKYQFEPLSDGDEIRIGDARLTALCTTGHTLESMSYLLDDRAVFTGDTLFLEGVGRPDLEASAAQARERARLLWVSLQRLTVLSDDLLVLPAHTSSPVPFDGEPVTASLKEIKSHIPALQLAEEAFVDTILKRLPPTPPNHGVIVELNEAGQMPAGDPTDLEAGANRCAIS